MPTQQFFSYIIFFWGEEGSADKTLDLITKEYYFKATPFQFIFIIIDCIISFI
jgi:hypothetical protein